MNFAPLMFISHGSPMFAIDSGLAEKQLAKQSTHFDHIQAIIVISAHWITQGNYITTIEHPEVLYDFRGFPQALYELQYPALGSSVIASKVITLLRDNGIECKADNDRGWDHGVWIPLRHLRPAGDKPVIQVSLNVDYSVDNLQQLGEILKQLRRQNIAIICSGSVTHNLYELRMTHDLVADYAQGFQDWVREAIIKNDITAIKHPETSNFYRQSHPSSDHYLPLIIALAASEPNEQVHVLKSPILHHTISMESYIWGM
ncbi:class III extradiol ring-cleavage dioxygenase [Psychromonas sp. 14N.309.X.WAT.B.A12]|uniref:DODA-type extradiol aromatic ring-opening family dioxygenase n=1 Tax=Psychromonas sp. 14N.309.X.WAT.B.A12 TaxID=2998322 RepID=UPI0025B06DD9|nr:class III extradiol ring-cleavage dioxygenase [Psychromonas sp. 14N.309.X.WAT.B.A12]MDN2661891.1 class III extradiol ring-cleavage dioxygenase [Psychromonas sp. 14N.309.X.WAT.B.A12]